MFTVLILVLDFKTTLNDLFVVVIVLCEVEHLFLFPLWIVNYYGLKCCYIPYIK